MKIQIALAAGLIAAVAGAASAAQVVQAIPYGPGTPNFVNTLNFNKFDGTLGTLTSVKVQVDLSINGGFLQLDNDGDEGASGTADLGAEATVTSMDVPMINGALQPILGPGVDVFNSSPFNIGGNDGDSTATFDVGTTDFFNFQGQPGSDMGMDFVNALFFGAYTDANGIAGGLDNYDVDVNVDQIFNYGALGGINFSGGPVNASGVVTITYEYTPIPAPGAAALLGLGGLLAARRRR